jgi:hypothetical protein
MPVYISDDFFVTSVIDSSFTPEPNCPLIGIENLSTVGNIFATASTDPTAPAWLTSTPATNERWRTTAAVSHTWSFQSDGITPIDYVGIAGHSGLVGRQFEITAELPGGGTVTALAPRLVTGGEVIFARFSPTVASVVHITFSSVEPFAFSIGVINVGRVVALPRKIYVGHTPINYGRSTTKQIGISDSGAYLGQRVTRVSLGSSVSIDNVPPAYYRNVLYNSFHIPSETRPFFWAWRPQSYPYETGYCWLTSDMSVSNSKANGFMSMSFNMTGFMPNG